MTRSVRDSAVLLDIAVGADSTRNGVPQQSFAVLATEQPRRLRIGLQTRAFNDVTVDAACLQMAHEAAILCEQLGHIVEPVDLHFDLADIGRIYGPLSGGAVIAALRDRGEELGRHWTCDDLEPISYGIVERGLAHTASDYVRALGLMLDIGQHFTTQFAPYDVLLSPTTATAGEDIESMSLYTRDLDGFSAAGARCNAFTLPFNVSGHPAMSVPLGWPQRGIPIGVHFGARYGDDATLLQLATQLEEARPWMPRYVQVATQLAAAFSTTTGEEPQP